MKKYLIFLYVILLFLPIQIHAQTQTESQGERVDYPWVPRVSAYEAYVKHKAGRAIILHGGGEAFSKRHILGAFNLEKYNDQLLLKFPKEGIEIFTYCY
jgi:hypothetical protein